MKRTYSNKKNVKRIKIGGFKIIFFFALVLAMAPASFLAQNSFTFTAAGLTGPVGPTQTQLNTAYFSTNLNGSVTATGGIQSFTIPITGPYRITAVGAQGGYNGGRGASVAGTYTLTAGTVLKILVGQQGTTGTNSAPYTAGGGGGSFVSSPLNAPYVVAGGGGGNGDGYTGIPVVCCLNGMEATITTNGNPHPAGTNGGTGGNGGSCPSYGAGSGAGYYGDGVLCYAGTIAMSYTNGGAGGNGFAYSGTLGNGGFGGGGGHADSGTGMRGGGGGGYSGGGGGAANSGNDAAGGGGGSYNTGANQINSVSTATGNGVVIVDLLCNINITSSGSNSLAPSMCTGNSLTLTTNAVSNFTWSTGNTTTTSIVVSPSSNTTYSIIGTSSLNCQSTSAINVTVNSSVPVLSISNPSNNICLGRTVSLTASGALSYTWANPGVVNGQTFTPSATTIYTVTGQNGCGSTVGTTTITVAPLPVSVSATSTLVCQGYPSTLTAVSSVSGYTWQPGPLIGSTAIVAPLANTIYTVSAADGTCSGTQTVLITTKTTPTISTSATLTTLCEGQSVNLSATGAGAGGTYSWSPGGPGASITLTPPASTAVTVAGTNSLNCTSTAMQIILVNSAPPLTVVANKTLVCGGESAVLTAGGASGYSWVSGPPTSVYTVTPTGALTTYTVIGSHSTNTCTATRTIVVAALIPNVTVTSTTGICPGGTAVLTASGASTYSWNGVNTGGTGSYQTNPTATTVYSLVAFTSSNSVNCPSYHTATVVVFSNPTINVTPGKETICKGETHTLTVTGAVTYSWNTAPGTGSVVTVQPNSTSLYDVTGTDANGCQHTISYSAKVSACVSISEVSGNQSISIYPNPSAGDFLLTTSADITLRIVNSIGQELRVIHLNGGNDHKAQIRDLSSGVYFIVGENAEGKVSQKIIVTK